MGVVVGHPAQTGLRQVGARGAGTRIDHGGSAGQSGEDLGGIGEVVTEPRADRDHRGHRAALPGGGLIGRDHGHQVDAGVIRSEVAQMVPLASLPQVDQFDLRVSPVDQPERLDEDARPLPFRCRAGVEKIRSPGSVGGDGTLGREHIGIDAIGHDGHPARSEFSDALRHAAVDRQHVPSPGQREALERAHHRNDPARCPGGLRGVGPHVRRVVGVRDPSQGGDRTHDRPRRGRRLGDHEVGPPAGQKSQGQRQVEAHVLGVAANVTGLVAQHRH